MTTTLDSREPPNGDFVAYVEKIEREQLARAMQPHKLPHLSAGGKVVTDTPADGTSTALAANEAQRVLQVLSDQRRAPVGPVIGAFIGAALIVLGLMAEGGIFLVLIGAVLLWHNLRKLRRAGSAARATAAQRVDQAFGGSASSATGKPGR